MWRATARALSEVPIVSMARSRSCMTVLGARLPASRRPTNSAAISWARNGVGEPTAFQAVAFDHASPRIHARTGAAVPRWQHAPLALEAGKSLLAAAPLGFKYAVLSASRCASRNWTRRGL
jgi:hypothetical protein